MFDFGLAIFIPINGLIDSILKFVDPVERIEARERQRQLLYPGIRGNVTAPEPTNERVGDEPWWESESDATATPKEVWESRGDRECRAFTLKTCKSLLSWVFSSEVPK